MQFVQRVQRLVRADAHGLIESLEDQELLLKQHLREADFELQRKRARLEVLSEEERALREDVKRLDDEVANLDADMHLALAKEREELARFAIRKIIPRRRETTTLSARIAEIVEERERIAQRLETQELDFEALRGRVRTHLASLPRDEHMGDPLFGAVADEEVELELLRWKQAAGGVR
jgi:phage shock protein A